MKDKSETGGSLLSQLPRTFWVANVMELFERGAYYGMNALLGRYLTDKVDGALGFGEDEAGLLQSVVYAATYVIPILGGALADRYGYRRLLIVAFSLLSSGYFLSSQVTAYGTLMLTLLIMATGSGLFKPVISGTIARTTDERTSGFGFGVYYWMINIGAFGAPFIAGYLRGFSYRYVFAASAAYCGAMLLPTLLLYKDPPKPTSTKSLGEVLGGALTVLSDARFMLLIFVYSCFWILYFQNFGTVLWYLRDFVDAAPANAILAPLGLTFDAEFVTIISAGTIVALQIPVGFAVKNIPPLPTMIGGITIGALGFFCLAASSHIAVFVLGIAVFAIGEMTCHPKYYAYIGTVAPQETKATYMGYAFLYGVIGSLVGSNLGGELYVSLLGPLVGTPDAGSTAKNFWLGFALTGLGAAAALFVYDKLIGKDTEITRRRARSTVMVIYGALVLGAPGMLIFVNHTKGGIPAKTLIQCAIMLLLGVGGLWTLLRRGQAHPAP